MGLIEKRLIKLGQEEWVPAAQKELRELTGGAQVYEVDWTTFLSDAEALQNLQNQGLRRINGAFRHLCRDDLGKEAANEQIKKVVLINVESPSEKSIALTDGVVTVKCAWSKGSDGYFADLEMAKVLEKSL
ncbi:MAG: hypothetical protein HUU21_17820 [Polyangiaceae bacterium]|nr:hypothetical protein [Polyangiaceae bacterium]NUQ75409.1 hypothetical protein [Polyangiaceae bacterium]